MKLGAAVAASGLLALAGWWYWRASHAPSLAEQALQIICENITAIEAYMDELPADFIAEDLAPVHTGVYTIFEQLDTFPHTNLTSETREQKQAAVARVHAAADRLDLLKHRVRGSRRKASS